MLFPCFVCYFWGIWSQSHSCLCKFFFFIFSLEDLRFFFLYFYSLIILQSCVQSWLFVVSFPPPFWALSMCGISSFISGTFSEFYTLFHYLYFLLQRQQWCKLAASFASFPFQPPLWSFLFSLSLFLFSWWFSFFYPISFIKFLFEPFGHFIIVLYHWYGYMVFSYFPNSISSRFFSSFLSFRPLMPLLVFVFSFRVSSLSPNAHWTIFT